MEVTWVHYWMKSGHTVVIDLKKYKEEFPLDLDNKDGFIMYVGVEEKQKVISIRQSEIELIKKE